MTIRGMNNTEIFCLLVLARDGWWHPKAIALARWPNSARMVTKTTTIKKHLNRLVKHGFAMRVGTVYAVTDCGRDAVACAKAGDRPVMLGLAGM